MITICPSCGYQRQPTDTAPDYECPKCRRVYAKFKSQEEREAEARAKAQERVRIEQEKAEQAAQLKRDRETLARQSRAEEEAQAAKLKRRKIQVVVTDIQIPFGAMFWLCVQFTMAALPAIIVAILIVIGFFAIFGGVGSLLGKLIATVLG